MFAQDFDEHHLGELGEHGLAARSTEFALLGGDVKEMGEPALAGGGHLCMKHARQGFEQRIERPRIAAEVPTNKMTVLGPSAVMVKDERKVATGGASIEVKIGFGAHAGRGTQNVGVAIGKTMISPASRRVAGLGASVKNPQQEPASK